MSYKVFRVFIHAALIGLFFPSCNRTYSAMNGPLKNIPINQTLADDSLAESMILPYRKPLQEYMQEVVAFSNAPAVKGLPESSMGNLIADLLREGAEQRFGRVIDVAFLNTGGLRVEWPAGPISRAMVFELMPFENITEVVVVSGSGLRNLLNQAASRGGSPVSGVTFEIHDGLATAIKIGGQALDDTRNYTMASTDYLLNNGDKYAMPAFIERKSLEIKFRDLLLEMLNQKQSKGITLNPQTDGRVR